MEEEGEEGKRCPSKRFKGREEKCGRKECGKRVWNRKEKHYIHERKDGMKGGRN